MKKTTFKCATCRNVFPVNASGGTGYGTDSGGRKHCYACCAARDRRTMIRTGRAVLYLVDSQASVGRAFTAQNWPGTLSFPVNASRRSRNNFGAGRIDAWFAGPDGKTWHGVNVGDNQLLRCKRLKGD